jgi:hypothetical protein
MLKALLFVAAIFAALCLHAQDSHYWTSPYCSGGGMIGGAFVSDNRDSGVLFINPALLARSRMNSIALSTNGYTIETTTLHNGAGDGYNLRNRSLRSIPLLVAGNVKVPIKRPLYFAYGIINAPGMRFSASQRRDEMANVLDDSYSPGEEQFVGQYIQDNEVAEFSFIGALAFPFGKNFSAGISMEGISRSGVTAYEYHGRAITNADPARNIPLVSTDISYMAKFTSYSGRIKLGLAWTHRQHSLGMTVKLPEIHPYGRGVILSDEVIHNMGAAFLSTPFNLIASTRQDKLKVVWKTPVAIALGYSIALPKTTINVCAEYFTPIKTYNIMTPTNDLFIRPDTGQVNNYSQEMLSLKDKRSGILNAGISGARTLSKHITFLLSFRTDFSYSKRGDIRRITGYYHALSDWDIYHTQLGINWRMNKYRLQLAVMGSYGTNPDYEQEINLSNATDLNLLTGNPHYIKATYYALGLTVSYVHNF